MKRSFFVKTLFSYLTLSVVILLLILIFTLPILRRQNEARLLSHLQELAATLQIDLVPLLENDDPHQIQQWIQAYKSKLSTRVTLINDQGQVLADSSRDPREMENHLNRPEVASALKGIPASETHFSRTLRQAMLYYACPVHVPGSETPKVLRLSLNIKTVEEFLRESRGKIYLLLLFVFLASLLLAFYLSSRISRPIKEIIGVSNKIVAGDLSATVPVRRHDELKIMAVHFNEMTAFQRQLIEKLQGKQVELETVLDSIADPLIVLDREEHVQLMNQAFLNLINSAECIGRFHWETIREPDFQGLLQSALKKGENLQQEVEIQDKTYFGTVHFLSNQKGLVVLLRDMTEQKRLEKIKKDFIVNMSHELRTPLTSIKGFLETMAEEEPESNRKYLQIVQRNTERLIHIVQDLLTLAELEEKSLTQPENREIDFVQLAEQVSKVFEKRADEKKLDFGLEIISTLPKIRGDAFLIEQMLINLLDNALKYTEKGFIRMKVSAGSGFLIIDVRDSGIGIPPEHQQRIFERFYVVDKSRSRSLGGTGLGLSIVKHIVKQHLGEIEMESEPGTGTRFIIKLPISGPST